MKVTLVQPCIGRVDGRKVNRRRVIESLSIATLAGLTPQDVDREFFDERLEDVDFDTRTDLVGISTETLNARRAYEIAAAFRSRGVPVVLGGFHPSLVPREALKHADAVVVGQAEGVWQDVIRDRRKNRLRRLYRGEARPPFGRIPPDRSIFRGKRYLPVQLVEFGRGCAHRCDFCSVHRFFGNRYAARPLDTLVAEIASSGRRNVLFVDDNLFSNRRPLDQLCRELARLGVRWVGQASVGIARDEAMLDRIAESGCKGLLIGFESIRPGNLRQMNKRFNRGAEHYRSAVRNLKARHLKIYGSFVLGYDQETPESIRETTAFAIEQKLTIATFYPLTPFPGTSLHDRLKAEGRLLREDWWMDPGARYGGIFFRPANMGAEELAERCIEARRRFYGAGSLVRRALDLRGNVHGAASLYFYLLSNVLVGRDIDLKNRTCFGLEPEGPSGTLPAARRG